MSDAKLAWIDGALATGFAILGAWLSYVSHQAAQAAVREHGYNVDSGAIEAMAAIVYCAPVAFAFALASISLFLSWRIRWFAHWCAVLLTVSPIIFECLWSFFTRN